MSRYIDADEFEKYFNREEWRTPDEKWWPEREIGLLIALLSKSNVKEFKSGEWINSTYGLYCSACKTYQPTGFKFYHYCPICGAEMKRRTE